jgi:hypothetical protein
MEIALMRRERDTRFFKGIRVWRSQMNVEPRT